MLSPAATEALILSVRLPRSAADENNVPLLGQLTLLRGHRPVARPVEQLLEQLLRRAGIAIRNHPKPADKRSKDT